VRVIRVPSAAFGKRFLGLRALNYATYLVVGALRGLTQSRPDVVLAMTDPPFAGAIARGVAARFGVPLVVIVQDVFPETAAAVGRITNPQALRAIDAVVGLGLRRADRVVAIGETMRSRLEDKGVEAARIRVIPNWVDTEAVQPAPRDNEWARERDLVGRFVAMHFGNLGFAHDLDTLVDAAASLRGLDVRVVIVGRGAREDDLRRRAREIEADNVVFLPWQERELASLCLASADVHVVALSRGLAGYVVPSRLYGVLAAARPALVAAEEASEPAALARETQAGIVIPPGDPQALAAAIRAACDGQYDLDAMGRRGRDYVVREASRESALARYRELLAEVLRSGS
jgi:glycosyltransferase involved in cell wall biosynthesis